MIMRGPGLAAKVTMLRHMPLTRTVHATMRRARSGSVDGAGGAIPDIVDNVRREPGVSLKVAYGPITVADGVLIPADQVGAKRSMRHPDFSSWLTRWVE